MIDVNLSGTGGRVGGNGDFSVLRIELEGIQPTSWRSVIVPKSANLGWIHAVIQVAMGWTNSHLRPFSVDQVNRCLAKLQWPKVSVSQLGKVLAALHRAKA